MCVTCNTKSWRSQLSPNTWSPKDNIYKRSLGSEKVITCFLNQSVIWVETPGTDARVLLIQASTNVTKLVSSKMTRKR